MNQGPFQPYNPNAASTSKELVPTQNNLFHEPEWCFPCNLPHNQATCSNGLINQALMVQSKFVVQQISVDNTAKQNASLY